VIFGRPFLPASPLLSWLIFASFGFMLISMSTATLTAAGRPGLTLALTGPLVLLAPLAHGVLIPRFGPLGAAAATTVLAWLGGGATLLAVYQTYQVRPPAATLVRSALIGGLGYALAILWPAPGFWLFLKLPVITVVILLTFLLLGEFSPNEIALVRSILRGPLGRERKQREA
jgi:O-antigen/teichoic acid export membrane protein